MAPRRLTLGQVFALMMIGLALLLAVLFTVLLEGSRRSIIQAADSLRTAAGRRIEDRVTAHLAPAQQALEALERDIRSGAVDPAEPRSLEAALYSRVLNTPNLEELTLTRARRGGFDAEGALLREAGGREQLSVYRVLDGDAEGGRLVTRKVSPDGPRWRVAVRDRPPGAGLLDTPLRVLPPPGADPTEELTFTTPASRRLYGDEVWSDLHWSDLEKDPAHRRAVVTVMKALEDARGEFVGVARAGLLTEQLDEVSRLRVTDAADDPHRIFLADEQGRLITRVGPADRLEEQSDDSVRVAPASLPPEIGAALGHPGLREVGDERRTASGEATIDGRRYLFTFLALPQTQGWRVGVVAPEEFYLRDLARMRLRLLGLSLAVIAAILAAGALTLRAVRRGLGQVVETTARIQNFDFAPAEARSPFADLQAVLMRLELAKTAMRAMGRYVPIDLVRLLYRTGREPVLGGEILDVTLLFTDIKDFTSLSEQLSPNELARVLGQYLQVMTAAIHSTHGTIDKYIGDAIMAVWNTPTPCPDHARRACEAALACREAGQRLFSSPEWKDRPPLHTRFGIHRGEVMVGHFGAPDRMSFTALGDGVNLASRLEGLNKQYGTTILVSEAVREDAKEAFAFRLVDVVAVKGRTRGVRVYELLGRAEASADRGRERAYERALERYWARDFAGALAILEAQPADPPSHVLAERARVLAANPPPAEWDGVYVARVK
ncbi:MAG TPA: adenylate/guanylate cyclase domain-containing protein [Vicinamibacteria bacterium]|nr:adenylate/guanylate cyclase domain-containing protein [Vicinamibacteria bacterium]